MAMENSFDRIATVKDLIDHLESSFLPEQNLAFYDEGGAWIELIPVTKNIVGKLMFVKAKDAREEELKTTDDDYLKKSIKDSYRKVDDESVLLMV